MEAAVSSCDCLFVEGGQSIMGQEVAEEGGGGWRRVEEGGGGCRMREGIGVSYLSRLHTQES
jgi:hypothetical protein